jgi:hypothetical protein
MDHFNLCTEFTSQYFTLIDATFIPKLWTLFKTRNDESLSSHYRVWFPISLRFTNSTLDTNIIGLNFVNNWTLKNGVFWDVTPCGSCKNRYFGGGFSDVPSSPIHVTPMMEALSSSETSVITRTILRIIPEDAILHMTYLIHLMHSLFQPISDIIILKWRSVSGDVTLWQYCTGCSESSTVLNHI